MEFAKFASSQGFDPLPTQKVPPLVLFKKSIFGRPTLKYNNFERGVRAEKTRFFVKIFEKVPKNAFSGQLFQNFACGAENLAKQGLNRA